MKRKQALQIPLEHHLSQHHRRLTQHLLLVIQEVALNRTQDSILLQMQTLLYLAYLRLVLHPVANKHLPLLLLLFHLAVLLQMLQLLGQLLLQWVSQLHHRREICLALDQVVIVLTSQEEHSVQLLADAQNSLIK